MDVDSLSGEKMMSVAIDEVVISASNRRNLVERNGKINVEFVVSVPQELQARNWQLVVDPQLLKGADTLAFDPLVYSGDRFRTMQRREYARYDDCADYFERFGDKRAYARYMDRVAEQRTKYADAEARLERMTPEEAMFDRQVGWTTRGERRRQYARLRRYVTATDRKVRERTSYGCQRQVRPSERLFCAALPACLYGRRRAARRRDLHPRAGRIPGRRGS